MRQRHIQGIKKDHGSKSYRDLFLCPEKNTAEQYFPEEEPYGQKGEYLLAIVPGIRYYDRW